MYVTIIFIHMVRTQFATSYLLCGQVAEGVIGVDKLPQRGEYVNTNTPFFNCGSGERG